MKSAVSVIGCLVVSCAPVEQGEDSWASAGFSATVAKELTDRVEQMLGDAIADGAFPGAVALISRHGRPLVHVAAGTETYERGSKKVTRRSLFDLASLTKVCATGPAVLRLVMAGKLRMDTRVADLLPSFRGEGKEKVTVGHLMAHASGLPSHVKFFQTLKGKKAIVAAAIEAELTCEPGERTVYSDLGLIVLMACVEKVSGMRFARLVKSEVFDPLGMKTARFAATGRPIDAVPTERDTWRGDVVRGQVHDENAFAMGGVSGHAGLFAAAEDVARIGHAFLDGGSSWLSPEFVKKATRPANIVEGSSRGLCWDTFRKNGSGGSLLSPEAFGHTGFTGTSIWCDPKRGLCIVLLTNRVHPTRANRKITAVRAQLADLVIRTLAH